MRTKEEFIQESAMRNLATLFSKERLSDITDYLISTIQPCYKAAVKLAEYVFNQNSKY